MKRSRIVVVIAHYNNPNGLKESLLSINEPFGVDVIIVDDGSKYKPQELVLQDSYKLGILHFEYLDVNSGVGIAANLGLKKAKEFGYELIARFDCGDIFHKNKLQKQLDYLDENKDVKLLGTWANVVDSKGVLLHQLKHPREYETIKKKMYLNSMFLNPSVVFYTEILEKVGNYPLKYRRASQDYAFFFKVIKQFESENYPEVLIDYVADPNSITTKKRRLQVANRIRVIFDNFYFGYYPVYGIIRNFLLLFVSRNFTTNLKKKLNRDD